ncbi:MAG TPA: ubiquinol oxidase subunit II [Candidatus Saccharimonadales bacterium]|nr:ubiquinol oxidase subunit II [Candidatus Saccharimonadales bacterium]
MNKKQIRIIIGVIVVWFVALVAYYVSRSNVQVLNPKGTIAYDERNLIVFTTILSVFVLLPVFTMTFWIAWKYREGNTKAKYQPDWDHSPAAEVLWWGIPTLIIVILSVVTWNTSHSLDPHKPLKTGDPLKIQVVALDWKWLFIYPEQKIASVNYVQFPVDKPVQFEITSNGPMNSFWIPQLGGQIYAMAGMSTHLNLEADQVGDYRGSSANISGKGFAGMTFTARASSGTEFNSWVIGAQSSASRLDMNSYEVLAKPSENYPPAIYASAEPGLYNKIQARFQLPGGGE